MLAQEVRIGIGLRLGRLDHVHGQIAQMAGDLPRIDGDRLAAELAHQLDIGILLDIGQPQRLPRRP